MKQGRHDKIRELIQNHDISTQDELLSLLREGGYNVTQATVSRDIKQLRLVKTLSGTGKYIYSVERGEPNDLSSKFDSLLAESAVKIDYVANQIIVKCYSGLANAVCAALDTMRFDGIVGTLAGDDTILIIMRTEAQARQLFEKLSRKIQ